MPLRTANATILPILSGRFSDSIRFDWILWSVLRMGIHIHAFGGAHTTALVELTP